MSTKSQNNGSDEMDEETPLLIGKDPLLRVRTYSHSSGTTSHHSEAGINKNITFHIVVNPTVGIGLTKFKKKHERTENMDKILNIPTISTPKYTY